MRFKNIRISYNVKYTCNIKYLINDLLELLVINEFFKLF